MADFLDDWGEEEATSGEPQGTVVDEPVVNSDKTSLEVNDKPKPYKLSDRGESRLREMHTHRERGMWTPSDDEFIEEWSNDEYDQKYGWDKVTFAILHKNSLYTLWRGIMSGRIPLPEIPGASVGKIIFNEPEPENNFNLKQALDDNKIETKDRHLFVDCRNQWQFNNVLDYLEEDKRDEEILENASMLSKSITELITMNVDPVYFFPIGKCLKFFKVSTSVTRAAIEFAAISATNYSLRSSVKNEFEAENLALETMSGAAAGAIFAGAVEYGVPITKELFKDVKGAIKEAYRPNVERHIVVNAKGEVGLETKGIFGRKWEKANDLLKKFIDNSPKWMMYHSDDPVIKNIGSHLFAERVINPHGEGVVAGSSMEERLKLFQSKELEIAELIDKRKLKFIENSGNVVDSFDKEVNEIIRNTQIRFNKGEYEIIEDPNKIFYSKEAQDTADAITEFTADSLKYANKYGSLDAEAFNEGIKTKLKVLTDKYYLGEKPENEYITSIGHVFRKYNIEEITRREGDFRRYLTDMYRLNYPEWSAQEIEKHVNSNIATITGNKIEPKTYQGQPIAQKPTVLHEREIAISDEILFREGFMDYDAVTNWAKSIRTIKVNAELNRVAQECGFKSWEDFKDQYSVISNQKIGGVNKENLAEGQTPEQIEAERERLRNKFNYELKMVEDIEAIFRGNYNKFNPNVQKTIASIRALTFVETGGQLALACTLDLPMLILRHNFSRGLVNLFKDLAKGGYNGTINLGAKSLEKIHLPKTAEAFREWKVKNKKEVEEIFGALDASFERSRFNELGFYVDTQEVKNISNISDAVSKYTGVNVITRSLKTSAAEGEYSYLLNECLKENADMNYLAKMGISETGKSQIKAAYEAKGYKKDGLLFLDLKHIEDRELQDQIQMSIQTIVDQTIMTPGIGDTPRFLRSGWAQFFFMFKTYPYLIYNNFLRHIPHGVFSKKNFSELSIASLAITTAYKYIKDLMNGRETDPESSEFWREVFDYSVFSFFMTDAVEDAINVATMKYGKSMTSILSPTVSTIDRFPRAILNAWDFFAGKNLTVSQRKLLRNSTPIINYWYLRPLTNSWVESGEKRRGYRQ